MDIKDGLTQLVRQRAFVTEPSFDSDGAAIKVVSKMLRATTHYPRGGVAESWVIHVHPIFGSNRYQVDSVFYGDERLSVALNMYGIPSSINTDRVIIGNDAYRVPDLTRNDIPYNITVVHGRPSLRKYSSDGIRSSINGEWEVIQHVYSPKQLTELDLRQAEFAHKVVARIQQIGNPTFGLGELYIVDTPTFKRRLRSLGEFGSEVQNIANDVLIEFEAVEAELAKVELHK